MNRVMLFAACVCLLAGVTLSQEKIGRYSIYEAGQHPGELASVRGFVTEVVKVRKSLVHLNFGGHQPDQVLTIVISHPQAFWNFSKFQGAVIEVTGRITMHGGKPEIQLNSRRQLRYVEWAAGM